MHLSHTLTHQKSNKFTHKHSHTRNNTLTLVATVCKNIKKEQPELHQLTTKQQRKILSNRKNHTAVKRKKTKTTNLKEEQRLSKLCFNQQTQKS